MMTDAEKGLMRDLESLHYKWSREWAARVIKDTQPTREDEQRHLHELRKIITKHVDIDFMTLEANLK